MKMPQRNLIQQLKYRVEYGLDMLSDVIIKTWANLKSHKNVILVLMVILVLGAVPLRMFKGELVLYGGDSNFPLNARKALSFSLYTWWDSISTGIPNARSITAIVPFAAFAAFFEYLGFSTAVTQRLLFYLLSVSSGLSIYYLTSSIIKGNEKYLASIVAAIIYMLNPYTMVILWHHNLLVMNLLYSFFPLLLAFYIKGVSSKRTNRYVLLICATSLLLITTYGNVTFLFIALLPLVLYLIYYVVTNRRRSEIIGVLKFAFILSIVWIGINMWWLLPMAYFASEEYTSAFSVIGWDRIDILNFISQEASFLNILRLQGYWAFNSNYLVQPYYPYAPIFSSPIFILISFLFPILAFSSLFFRSKNRAILLYFSFLSIGGIFLSKGSHPPFGEAFIWAMRNIPFFGIFRLAFEKFIMLVALGYSVLIGNGFAMIYSRLNRVNKISATSFVIILIFLMSVIYVWPLWTGDVILTSATEHTPSPFIEVPTYYKNAGDWLKRQSDDFRIFPLPPPDPYGVAYKWEHGYAGSEDPSIWLFPKQVIFRQQNEFVKKVTNLLREKDSQYITKLLTLLNVKYILNYNDLHYEYLKGRELNNPWYSEPGYFQPILNLQKKVYLEKTFGKLDFYRNDFWSPLHIYATSSATLVIGGIDEMFQVVTSDNFTVGDSALFLSNDLDQGQIQFIKEYDNTVLSIDGNAPEITFQKINPTKYKVHVNASQPFFLVFSESYHPQWKAYIEDKPSEFSEIIASYENVNVKEARHEMKFTPGDISYLFATPLPDKNHFLVNGYANAWYIDPAEVDKDGGGEFFITLYFWPQSLFYLGLFISGMTFIGCVGYLFYDWRKGRGDEWVKKIERRLRRF